MLVVRFVGFLRRLVSDCIVNRGIVAQRVDKTLPPKPLGMDFVFFESIQVGMQYFSLRRTVVPRYTEIYCKKRYPGIEFHKHEETAALGSR